MRPRSNSATPARAQTIKSLSTKRKLGLAALAVAVVLTAVATAWQIATSPAAAIAPANGPEGMAWIPGGRFLMGSDHKLAQENERPAHPVRVDGFWMDRHHVTNAEFRKFVEATGYVTTAEKKPDWETMKVQVPPGTPKPTDSMLVPGAMVFVGAKCRESISTARERELPVIDAEQVQHCKQQDHRRGRDLSAAELQAVASSDDDITTI